MKTNCHVLIKSDSFMITTFKLAHMYRNILICMHTQTRILAHLHILAHNNPFCKSSLLLHVECQIYLNKENSRQHIFHWLHFLFLLLYISLFVASDLTFKSYISFVVTKKTISKIWACSPNKSYLSFKRGRKKKKYQYGKRTIKWIKKCTRSHTWEIDEWWWQRERENAWMMSDDKFWFKFKLNRKVSLLSSTRKRKIMCDPREIEW